MAAFNFFPASVVWLHGFVLIGMLVPGVLGSARAAEPASSDDAKLCVMTFNLRFASPIPPNSWPERRPVVRDCIRSIAPDLIGTQEGLYQQVKDVAADAPEYDWIGLGREGGSRGEFMAVFYRKDRFEPLEYDHYWLSDTPLLIASTNWGNNVRRMVTWVKFHDRRAQQTFYFVNSHFDHESQPSREKSAELVRQRIDAWQTQLPVVFVADFNAAAETNKVYHMLVRDGGFTDAWLAAKERRNDRVNTFHGYKEPLKEGKRIDWILTRGPVEVLAAETVTFKSGAQYPSDHFPVAAWIKWASPVAAGP